MRLPLTTQPGNQRGFGLMEILVGVLIGMIGIVVIFQVLQLSEERKRTTGAGSDAQISGSIGMYSLHRDVQLAGYGFGVAAAPMMGCSVSTFDTNRPVNNFNFSLSPIVITDGAGGAPDTITVLWGNSSLLVSAQTFDSATGTSKHTQGRPGFQTGDLVVAATAIPACALVEITGNNNIDGASIDHNAGTYVNSYLNQTVPVRYNPPGGSPINAGQGFLYDLGPSPRLNVWRIQNNKLTVTDDLHWIDNDGDGANDPTEIADGVINLQAQYGVDADNNNMIADTEWTNAVPADWTKVRAIRVALLARSQQYEKAAVTAAPPAWVAGPFTMTNVDGTPDSTPGGVNDWRNYRYRVYQIVIPLRNMIWGTI